jgi:hypothetical protein
MTTATNIRWEAMSPGRAADWHLLVDLVKENLLQLKIAGQRTRGMTPVGLYHQLQSGGETQSWERWSKEPFSAMITEVSASLDKALTALGYKPNDIREVLRQLATREEHTNAWLLHTLAAMTPASLAALLRAVAPGLQATSLRVEWPHHDNKASAFADGWLLGEGSTVALEIKVRGSGTHAFTAQQLVKYLWLAEQVRRDGKPGPLVLVVGPQKHDVRSMNLRGLPADAQGNWQVPVELLRKDREAAKLLKDWGWSTERLTQELAQTRFRSVTYEQLRDAAASLPAGAVPWAGGVQEQLQKIAEEAANQKP